jgi:hypothetical protein
MFGLKGSEVQTEKGIWQPSQCSNSNGLTRVDGNFRDDQNSGYQSTLNDSTL